MGQVEWRKSGRKGTLTASRRECERRAELRDVRRIRKITVYRVFIKRRTGNNEEAEVSSLCCGEVSGELFAPVDILDWRLFYFVFN